MLMEKKENRPLSPHITIYRRQITSVLSIFHRLTGVGLFFGLSALVWVFNLFIYSGFCSCILSLADNIFVKIIASLFSFAYFYHLCTGIRHLTWDAGFCFSVKAVTATGIAAVLCSLAFTLIFWLW